MAKKRKIINDDRRKTTMTRFPKGSTYWPKGSNDDDSEEDDAKTYVGGKPPRHGTRAVSPPSYKDYEDRRGSVSKKEYLTSAQMDQVVGDIQSRIYDGSLAYGNVELAALLGHKPSQLALGRDNIGSMNLSQLFDLLLDDPNIKIQISIGGESSEFDL